MLAELKERLRGIHITKREAMVATALMLLLYISSVMMFFGMNFWLWSFSKELKRSYTSILVPSLGWCILFFFALLVLCVVRRFQRRAESFFFWFCRTGFFLVFLIGLFDSLAGLCGMYAAVHVPVILQSACISTGPIWTYFLAYFLFPESQPPFSWPLLLVLVCTASGVALATVPQIQSHHANEYFSPYWITIFLCATALFPLYNVLQGRFLCEFRGCSSPFTSNMSMLTGEVVVQFVLTLMYFPVDAAPFFGKCDSLQESWYMLISSLQCIITCSNNALYMVVYILGFWFRHIIFAFLNNYSPSVAAVTNQLTQPINTFLLLIFPSWNVYGEKTSWFYTFGCFLFLLSSTVIFFIWHLLHQREQQDLRDSISSRLTDMSKREEVIPEEKEGYTLSFLDEKPSK